MLRSQAHGVTIDAADAITQAAAVSLPPAQLIQAEQCRDDAVDAKSKQHRQRL
jgi:hypothetical protein